MKAKFYDFTGKNSFRVTQAMALQNACSARRGWLVRMFSLRLKGAAK